MSWIREAGASKYFSPLIAELLFSENIYRIQKELTGISENLLAFVSEGKEDGSHVNHTMWHKENINKISSHMLRLVKEDSNFLSRFIAKFLEINKLHQQEIDNNNLNDPKTIITMMEEAAGFMFITQPHCVEKIEREVLNYFYELKPQKSPQEILSLLTQPEELSTPTKERLEFLRILIGFNYGWINEERIENHFKKFKSCFMSEVADHNQDIDEKWLKNKITEELKNKDIDYLKKEFDSIVQGIKDLKKRKREVISNYNFSEQIIKFCNTLETFAYYRLESHLIWMTWFLQMSNLAKKKAKELGVSEIVIENMRLHEFIEINTKKALEKHHRRIPDNKIDLFVIHIDKNYNHSVLFEEEAKQFLEENNIRLLPPNLNYLKGNTAYPGKVVGKVKLIDESESLEKQMANMKEGDILVAWQTKPNMLPAILKAGAIVTNEGGITSHAAIVAREFKKPCVMMTRWATDFLKDGDLVEVDADKGIVRKMK